MLYAFGLNVNVYDPFASRTDEDEMKYRFYTFPTLIEVADFVIVTCALTPQTKHLLNEDSFAKMKDGVRIVNVSRGGVIEEASLVRALESGKVHSAALDVFEHEPLAMDSPLRNFERCIFGTHNGSNTIDAVRRASKQAMKHLFTFLNLN